MYLHHIIKDIENQEKIRSIIYKSLIVYITKQEQLQLIKRNFLCIKKME